MLKRNFKVSVIVLCYNAQKYIADCLRTLKNQTYPNLEIIIINNGSQDGSEVILEKLARENNYIFINNSDNLGYARGNNIGIEKAAGDYIMMLNPDVILDRDYILKIVEILDTDSEIGAVSGKILKYRLQDKNIVKTKIIDTKGLKIFRSHRVVEIDANKKDDLILPDEKREVFGISAAAAIYRRKALDDVKAISYNKNYLDDDFFIYKEDVDLSWRLRHAGWKIYYIPGALAYHHRWETGSSDVDTGVIKNRKLKSELVNYYSYRNHFLLIFKNQFLLNLIIFFPAIFLYELKKFIYLLLFERKTIKGLVDFILSLSLTLQKRNAILSKSKLKPSDIRRWF